jgi:hypothetical protein
MACTMQVVRWLLVASLAWFTGWSLVLFIGCRSAGNEPSLIPRFRSGVRYTACNWVSLPSVDDPPGDRGCFGRLRHWLLGHDASCLGDARSTCGSRDHAL